ncbi:MAE_28990/MAE_18760 family HEPN-like nuclease [Microcoleus sp. N9_B2]|uniref:MAE_28990/MAE_18760 family HEPN-like nuclease n=1 Tax=unclassified Microcoleus TaxID=2642155 RepID=UPI002FD32565
MNRTSLNSFQTDVNQIREYLKHIQYVNDVVGYAVLEEDNQEIKSLLNTLKKHEKSFRIEKRVFEYKAAIISLYGLLEQYVETWVKEYLDSLSSLVPEYNQIDEKIRDNHFELSLKLIDIIINRELAKYKNLTKEEVLRKLNHCIVNLTNYQINTEAFVLSSGNLKHNKIVELFKPLNVDLNTELIKNESLNREIGLAPNDISNKEKDILYYKINDLVERRNQIAHGSEILDILNISELEPYIQFLELYCQAIFETLFEKFIKQESIHSFKNIEKVVKIFCSQILAFEIENYTIEVGDMLIIKTTDGRFYKKPILDIELDKIKYQKLTISEKKNIAVRVDHKIKETQTFYIKKIRPATNITY